jgi:TolB-like protein/Tfp pilus assembly protein PilF
MRVRIPPRLRGALPVREGRSLGGFVRELRRRQVFRVALAYGGVGWVVIQASSALVPALAIPAWTLSLVALLTILGFPVALVLAWAVEVGPDGLRWEAPPEEPRRERRPPRASVADPSPRTLAALPFADRSPEGGFQYLGDGLSEELISALTQVEGLRVVARSSAFAFRGDAVDVREVGHRLGVGAVVEGSVRVSGERLRVTAQVVDVATGFALWSTSREGRLEDVLRLQEEMARAIAVALGAGLLADPHPSPPLDPLAHRHYLLGRFHWNERTAPSLQRAVRDFRQATALAPGFARAYAGEADALALLMEFGLLDPAEGFPPARKAVDRALELAPHHADSHVAAALVDQMAWDWSGSRAAFQRAVELDPAHAGAHHRLALLEAWTGDPDAAQEALREARRLDPLAPSVAATEGWLLYYRQDGKEAIRRFQDILAEYPGLWPARAGLALALLAEGCPAEAVATLRPAAQGDLHGPGPLALLALALGRDHRPGEAEALARELRLRGDAGFVSPFHLALPLLGTGAEEEVLEALERAVEARAPQVAYLAVDPLFRPLHTHPRFRVLLAAAGLPLPGMGQ